MDAPADFWDALERLLARSPLVIDRPRGTPHPRYPDSRMPLDYGYLEGSRGSDGAPVDIWRGSGPPRLDAVACTVDLTRGDVELKLLVGCSKEEIDRVRRWHDNGGQRVLVIERGGG